MPQKQIENDKKSKVSKWQINVEICQIVHLGFGLIVQSPNRWQGTQWMELALGTSVIAARNGGRLLIYDHLSNATVSLFYILLSYALESVAIWEGYQTKPRGVISVALGPATVHRCASLCILRRCSFHNKYCRDLQSFLLVL